MTDTPMVIPEDLKELYDAAKGVEGIGLPIPWAADRAIELIDRIARLVQENKMLRDSAHVRISDDELLDLNEKYGYFEFGDAQGAKSRAFADDVAALTAYYNQNARSEERIKNLEQALRELLHWIYPRTGDPDHRCAHFLDEVVIAYQLLNDPSPFEAPPKATQTKEGS